jgi:hypothetical protein
LPDYTKVNLENVQIDPNAMYPGMAAINFRTNPRKSVFIRNCWTEMLAQSLAIGHICLFLPEAINEVDGFVDGPHFFELFFKLFFQTFF